MIRLNSTTLQRQFKTKGAWVPFLDVVTLKYVTKPTKTTFPGASSTLRTLVKSTKKKIIHQNKDSSVILPIRQISRFQNGKCGESSSNQVMMKAKMTHTDHNLIQQRIKAIQEVKTGLGGHNQILKLKFENMVREIFS
jgi:hypothetical protein